MTFRKVLVANRGEIACRIINTCKRLNIATVAIFTEVDARARHVQIADERALLTVGGAKGYLESAEILRICKELSVDAVHPGYGFLSENHEFCELLENSGITFIGPTPESIKTFGLKHLSRDLAVEHDVPVIAGSGLLESADVAAQKASEVGYPILLKATAGGGGIGMYECANESELRSHFEGAQRAAKSFFSNAALFLEKYYPRARHVEVQVFGDGFGEVFEFGERECSVQRRHQKVLEETPSPFILGSRRANAGDARESKDDRAERPSLRADLCAAAVRLAKALSYRGAGTVEFLVDDDSGKFFFLEMNTRLQVEHAVTELVRRGLDLVELQIKTAFAHSKAAASEAKFDLSSEVSAFRTPKGHSIEARIYAENPSKGFVPSPGLLTEVYLLERPYIRYDTWVSTGTQVSPNYDPLLAKVIVWGKDRRQAVTRLGEALRGCRFRGPPTNLEFLAHVVSTHEFTSGNALTTFLDRGDVGFVPNAIFVSNGGSYATVQDFPARLGVGYGITVSGAMDDLSLRLANALVGNPLGRRRADLGAGITSETCAGLEITYPKGPELHFNVQSIIAVCGAPVSVSLNGEEVPMWTRVHVPASGVLKFGKFKDVGARAYLAVFGGIDVPDYLQSKSTSVECAVGGYQGRTLRAGDMLPLSAKATDFLFRERPRITLPKALTPQISNEWRIGAMSGPQSFPDYFLAEDLDMLFGTDWEVSHNSNRMGVRLIGPKPKWSRVDGGEGGSHPSNIHDNGYSRGSVNFTGDMPVIFGPEAPSMGGFVCAAVVVTGELWKLGQLRPGDKVRFVRVDQASAVAIHNALDRRLAAAQRFSATGNDLLTASDEETNLLAGGDVRDSAILATLEHDDERNLFKTVYRQGGDSHILVEYGEMVLDFNLRARVYSLQQLLQNLSLDGVGFLGANARTLLIQYDARVISQQALLDHLLALERQHGNISELKVPSRVFRFPIALDDRWTKETIERYASTIRPHAPYIPSNLDFIAKNNGVPGGVEEALETLTTKYLVVGVGFYLGCPFSVSVDPRSRMVVPKYNPARTFTYAGGVGIGGSFLAIYCMDGPGGYQLYGRTLPVWDTFGKLQHFSPEKLWLFRDFDQVEFYHVSDDELEKFRSDVLSGNYEMDIRETVFDLEKSNEFYRSIEHELLEIKRRQAAGAKEMEDAERESQKILVEMRAKQSVDKKRDLASSSELKEGEYGVCTEISGSVWKWHVQSGDSVAKGAELGLLEAMKMEIAIVSEESGVVDRFCVDEGQSMHAGDVLVILRKA